MKKLIPMILSVILMIVSGGALFYVGSLSPWLLTARIKPKSAHRNRQIQHLKERSL